MDIHRNPQHRNLSWLTQFQFEQRSPLLILGRNIRNHMGVYHRTTKYHIGYEQLTKIYSISSQKSAPKFLRCILKRPTFLLTILYAYKDKKNGKFKSTSIKNITIYPKGLRKFWTVTSHTPSNPQWYSFMESTPSWITSTRVKGTRVT